MPNRPVERFRFSREQLLFVFALSPLIQQRFHIGHAYHLQSLRPKSHDPERGVKRLGGKRANPHVDRSSNAEHRMRGLDSSLELRHSFVSRDWNFGPEAVLL